MMRRLRNLLVGQLKTARDEESGVILLISVLAAATVAAGVATALLLNSTGPRPEIRSNQANADKLEKINQAIILHAIQDSNYLLPCPANGTDNDGVSEADCHTTSGQNTGVVPWSTLGLSKDDASDAYGNVVVYSVSVNGSGPLEACVTSGGAATGAVTTGSIVTQSGVTPVAGSSVLYALVSQGANGAGAITQAGNTTPVPNSANENQNCAFGSTCTGGTASRIHTGPYNDDGNGTDHFDDEVLLFSSSDIQAECTEFASSSQPATVLISDSFGDSSGDGAQSGETTVTITGGSSASTEGSGVLTVTEDVSINSVGTRFTPDGTPLYTRIFWTPGAGTTTNTGFSIITRADLSTRAGGTNTFTDGITCQFFNDGDPATDQTIQITASGAGTTTSGADVYDLNLGTQYELECFDNGNDVWARITEVGTTSNQATVTTTIASEDEAVPNQVIFLHDDTSGAVSTLDDLLVGIGQIVLELDSVTPTAEAYADEATAPLNSGGQLTNTNYTQESWVYLRDSTSAGVLSIFNIRDTNASGTDNSQFDLDLGGSALRFTDSNADTLAATGQTFSSGRWNHYAFDCNNGTSRTLLINGTSVASDAGNCGLIGGGTFGASDYIEITSSSASTTRYLLAETNLWESVRTSADVTSNYTFKVLQTNSDVFLNYGMDDDLGRTDVPDTAGHVDLNDNLVNARYVGFLSPFSSQGQDVCTGATIDTTDPLKCIWAPAAQNRIDETIDIPLDVTEVLIKMWGGGGGGGENTGGNGQTGGGGGYATARLSSIGGDSIAGRQLRITAAGSGASGNDTTNDSGGGGGGSAVLFVDGGETLVLVAGGGGGGGARGTSSEPGYAGGGTTAEDTGLTPPTCDPTAEATQAAGGTASTNGNCAGVDGGSVAPANGGNGETIATGSAGGGYGFGGEGGEGSNNDGGGGGGGGYRGGAGGGGSGQSVGGGGGGAGYQIVDAGLTSVTLETGVAAAPGGNADTDRNGAGQGGASDSDGSPGRVVICWSSTCLP